MRQLEYFINRKLQFQKVTFKQPGSTLMEPSLLNYAAQGDSLAIVLRHKDFRENTVFLMEDMDPNGVFE